MDIPISEDEWRGEHGFALLDVMHLSPGDPCQLWITHRAELLRAWIEDRPGTRPQMWWHHDAPREPPGPRPGWLNDGKVEQPRLRLGGTGTAAVDVFDAVPVYHLGIPVEWCGPEELEWCAAEGIHAVLIDPKDPPRYEAKPPTCAATACSRAARSGGCRRTHSSQKRSASLRRCTTDRSLPCAHANLEYLSNQAKRDGCEKSPTSLRRDHPSERERRSSREITKLSPTAEVTIAINSPRWFRASWRCNRSSNRPAQGHDYLPD